MYFNKSFQSARFPPRSQASWPLGRQEAHEMLYYEKTKAPRNLKLKILN